MIEQGRMVFADSMEAFNNHMAADSLLLSLDNPPTSDELSAIPGITRVERVSAGSIRLRFSAAPDLSKTLIRMSLERGWELREIATEKNSLDQVFAQLSRRHS
jgi:ABC-2 type transport system ATP-binding protein